MVSDKKIFKLFYIAIKPYPLMPFFFNESWQVGSPILLKYKNPYKRNSMYPNISKCNAKSCTCCNHLICRSTIISSVNHRQFSVVNNSDLDWKSEDYKVYRNPILRWRSVEKFRFRKIVGKSNFLEQFRKLTNRMPSCQPNHCWWLCFTL